MRILHTADWHIGKILQKHPLQQEILLFFDWLLTTIQDNKVDVLLISGDIFDLANPSAADRKIYYEMLRQMVGLKLHIIITGGNHDSVGLLDAPQELLHQLDIHVIGGARDNIEEELVLIEKEEDKLIVAAVPFLRDKDLRNKETDIKYSGRTEAIREGIKDHYIQLANLCQEQYKNIPSVAMGHLFAIGATSSDSEREIHVGNAAAIEATAFPAYFDYIALGHIHRPQVIGKNVMIRYSGSPIALSFSEKSDTKSILLVDVKNNQIETPQILEVPKFRELRKFKGNLEEVKEKLISYSPDFPLASFVEIEINEEEFSSLIQAEVAQLKQQYEDNPKFRILKDRLNFKKGMKDTSELFVQGEQIENLKPIDVFELKLDFEQIEGQKKELLKDAFVELLEMVNQTEE